MSAFRRFCWVCVLSGVLPLLAWGVVAGRETASAGTEEMGKVRHVVLFDLKDELAPEKEKAVEEAARQMLADVEPIATLEWGENLTTNQRNEGYTHCLFVTF